MSDPVNHPSHYTAFGAEVIEITEHLGFCRGNAVKYIARAGRKDPELEVQDLEKARWYIDREITRLKREKREREEAARREAAAERRRLALQDEASSFARGQMLKAELAVARDFGTRPNVVTRRSL